MEKILLLEDEFTLGRNLQMVLKSEGYGVNWFTTGDEAVASALHEDYSLMLLDVVLKQQVGKEESRVDNGFEVARLITQQKKIPYILVTSRDQPIDILQGLDAGADDYITKPYNLSVLLARVRAVLRRNNKETNSFECNGLKIDLLTHKVTKDGKTLELTNQLFEILYYLIQNKNRVVSKDELYEKVWGYNPKESRETNTLQVNIKRLRHKIGPELIQTKRGIGYVFEG